MVQVTNDCILATNFFQILNNVCQSCNDFPCRCVNIFNSNRSVNVHSLETKHCNAHVSLNNIRKQSSTINELSRTCLHSNSNDHVNICKSTCTREANVNMEVGNVPNYAKNISPSSSTPTANLIFDDMQPKNDTASLTHTKIQSNHDCTKSTQTSNDNLSTFGLVKRGLRIANLNICHILNKVDEIKILLSEKRSVDILGVCETFLNNDVPDQLITTDGLGLANASIVETKFLELAMSLLDFSPRIPLGTFSILLFTTTHVPLQVDNLSPRVLVG